MTVFSDAELNAFRQQCDPVGDAVIQKVLDAGRAADISLIFSALIENDDPVPANLPDVARKYFEDSDDLPPWANLERVRRGQIFFNKYGAEMALMLSLASLPTCYGCADGAQVLLRSHRFARPANRRILETTQFVLDVMEVGGLDEVGDGRGRRSIQKVRLMHAAIRYYIRNPRPSEHQPPFDPAWGEPLNQEDLVNTLMSFSRVTIHGLERLGYRFDRQDEEDYFHAWRVIGHLLGIDDRLNPETVREGDLLLAQICRKNWKRSDAGRELTDAVISYLKEVVPMHFFDGIAVSILRRACGAELADLLDVPKADWTRHTLRVTRLLARAESLLRRERGLAGRVMSLAGRQLLEGFMRAERAKPAQFRIPPSLTGNWT